MMDDAVLYKKLDNHVALVTINRPDAMNAINGDVATQLDRIVRQSEEDSDVWVVILTGAGGKAFCAGADLKALSEGKAGELGTEFGGFAGFVYHQRKKPWIAAVEGYALAGGLEILLACEMAVASEKSQFGFPEVTRGIIAAAGGMFRLPRVVPRPIAMEILATGEHFDAKRAHELGLLNKVVPAGKVLSSAEEMANRIVSNAPLAVQESLSIAKQSLNLSEDKLIELSNEARIRNFLTNDSKEGPQAFVEKRPPNWTGT